MRQRGGVIGVGDGGESESDCACAESVGGDDCESLEVGAVGLESVMIREEIMVEFDAGWILDGVWAVMGNENLHHDDVLVCSLLFYPHDALRKKVKPFDDDALSFPHDHLLNLDAAVWGLDCLRKLLDLYVVDFQQDFWNDKTLSERTLTCDTRVPDLWCDLWVLRRLVRARIWNWDWVKTRTKPRYAGIYHYEKKLKDLEAFARSYVRGISPSF